MLKNYDPNFRYGVHTIEVTLQQWDYKGTVRVKIAGNCKGLSLMGDIDESIFDSFPDIESDCNFEIIADEWFVAQLKNASGDILEVEDDLDELRKMIVKVEIIEFVPETA